MSIGRLTIMVLTSMPLIPCSSMMRQRRTTTRQRKAMRKTPARASTNLTATPKIRNALVVDLT